MRRRDFLKALIGSTTALPFAATAQQSIPLIGYLHVGSPEPYALMVAAFREGLKEVGFVDGQNVHIEYRWAEGRVDRLPALAEELVSRRVAVLATGGGERSALVAKQATQIIPVVFVTGSNPVEAHLVESLNRPGGNVTGISFFTIELGPKRVGLLRDLIPNAHTIAVLSDSSNAGGGSAEGLAEVQQAARAVGYETSVVRASNAREIDEAFNAIGQQKTDALFVVSSPLFTNSRQQIVALANHHRIPAIYPLRDYVRAGGLLSYGASIIDAYRQSGVYTGRLLKGTTAKDMPIQQPTKFDLAINLATAKMLGLTIPTTLLATADEIIE